MITGSGPVTVFIVVYEVAGDGEKEKEEFCSFLDPSSCLLWEKIR